jgi:hypothetical protein
MKKFILAILILMPVLAYAGSGSVTTDRWDNKISGVPFAPYSTTWKVFTGGTTVASRAAATYTFDAAVLGIQVECTAGQMKFNSQSIGVVLAAATKYQFLRGRSVSSIIFSQTSSNIHGTCRITMF